MAPIDWTTESLQEVCEKVSSMEEFFKRNHMTLVYDTNLDDPERARLLQTIKGLHKVLERMITIDGQVAR